MTRSVKAIRQAGMTLLELMVSMLLATILIGGLFYMMSGQQKTYTNQVNVLSTQENLWGAMEYLERQIRMAGYGFGPCGGKILAQGTGDGGVDTLLGLEVFNNNNLFTGNSDGTDSFAVRYSETATSGQMNLRLTNELHPTSSSNMYISALGNKSPLAVNDLFVICMPGFAGTLAQVTGLSPAGDNDGDGVSDWKVARGPNAINPSNFKKLFGPTMKRYPPRTSIVKFGSTKEAFKFAIDNASDPPRLVMWRALNKSDLEVVASGVEDMQISWACDVQPLGAPGHGEFVEGPCTSAGVSCKCSTDDCSSKLSDEWANNVASDVEPICAGNPIQRVRLTLIARTAAPVIADKRGFRPEAEDHYEGSPSDDLTKTNNLGTYARAVLTSVVVPRNIKAAQQ